MQLYNTKNDNQNEPQNQHNEFDIVLHGIHRFDLSYVVLNEVADNYECHRYASQTEQRVYGNNAQP